MAVHITKLYGQAATSVAQHSQNMIRELARAFDAKEIGIYSFNAADVSTDHLAIRFDGMNAAISNGDIIIFQSPSWNSTHFDYEYIKRIRSLYSDIKIIIFIHDVVPLMFESNYYLMKKVIDYYNMADILIAPSETMVEILRKEGLMVRQILVQGIWDYLTDFQPKIPEFHSHINFAGHPERFPFLQDWTSSIPIKLFSTPYPISHHSNIEQEGWLAGDKLLEKLNENGGFGLVWPQGDNSTYYQANLSYKLSSYLAAGIPVIAPHTLSNAALIKEKGLGLFIDSLDDLETTIHQCTPETYHHLCQNVRRYRQIITQGYRAKKLLLDAIYSLYEA